jgi:hypothetical protein
MATPTVKVTGGEQLRAYLAKLEQGVASWTGQPIYVGYNRRGSHGRLIERGFHPRGGSTFVPGRQILERAKQQAERRAKAAVIKSIKSGGPAALAAKKQLAEQTATMVRGSTPRRTGGLVGSVTILVGRGKGGRR